MASTQTRAKFAYLKYESMMANLKDETLDSKKRLNAYDINFAPDTKECYVISPDLVPWAVKSKVYTFDSVESANKQLNQNTDTYSSQIVGIQFEDKYRAYIVNQNDNGFYVSSLCDSSDINYDEIGNRPIINLVGTLDDPIMVSELDTGIYKIRGQYKISNFEETIYLSASDTLFIIQNDGNDINIKRITSDDIINYSIKGDSFVSNVYITDEYLKENGYATVSYIDSKLETLESLIRKDLEEYVLKITSDTIEEMVDQKIDQKIDEKIDENIQPTSNTQITELFTK